jgi:hopanoid biosynthesis associated radical SAM protein HpnH
VGIPLLQAARIGTYVLRQHLSGRKRYPLVLMLEPLFRCNLACAGCGKIDYPDEILNQRLSYDECMTAIDECGAPVVSIAGGEPLLHREMPKIVEGYLSRGKFVILCTNALLLAKKIDDFKPHRSFTWSIHLDGNQAMHDKSVCQRGVYDKAVEAIRLANDSRYGLSGSVWTKDIDKGIAIAKQMETGAVFINALVKSDPRLPFGGIKKSGYGRELGRHGILEFVNAKTIAAEASK